VWSLLRHPRSSRERVLAFRDRCLRRLVRHAYARVPYWRDLFDRSAVHPQEIRTAADLARLPVTTKHDLQARPLDQLLACGTSPGDLVSRATSGSSGLPFTVRRSRREEDLLRVVVHRIAHEHGLRSTHKHAKVIYPRDEGSPGLLGPALRSLGLFRRQTFDCRLPPEEVLEQLVAFAPDFVSGYSGTLARVARLIDPARRPFQPQAVVTGSEVLTPGMRQDIARGFGAPVFDTYGSHEFTRVAYQCRTTGQMHVSDDTVIVEVLRDGRPVRLGERGEIVVTGLHSLTMPFIRYSLRDLVVRGDDRCACGQPYSTIRDLQGRKVDMFVRTDGRFLHPYELMAAIRDSIENWWITEYQLVQETRNLVVLRAVPRRRPAPDEVARIEAAAAAVLGPAVSFRCDVVGTIPPSQGGKFRTYRSLLRVAGGDEPHPIPDLTRTRERTGVAT